MTDEITQIDFEPQTVRGWRIFLTSGQTIEFSAAWNSGAVGSPSQFLEDVGTYHRTGELPDRAFNTVYHFPKTNSKPEAAAIIAVDIRQVVAVAQVF